jgi:hypothetical protein
MPQPPEQAACSQARNAVARGCSVAPALDDDLRLFEGREEQLGIMEQAHQTGHALDLVWIFDGNFDLTNAGIITLVPNI